VDVAAGGEVHHRVGAPADGPDQFLDFFLDRGGDGGVADIGVDLHQEVAADDHGLEFGVVDVGRDDGAAAGDLAADEFGGDEGGDVCAEVFAIGAAFFRSSEHGFAADVLAVGDVGHLGGDDAGAGVLELGEGAAGFGAQRVAAVGEFGDEFFEGDVSVVFRLHMAARVGLSVATRGDPAGADGGEAFVHVDADGGVGVGAGGVVDADGRLLCCRVQRDLAEGDQHIGEAGRGGVALGAGGQRAGGDLERLEIARIDGLVHGRSSVWPNRPAMMRKTPMRRAGMLVSA
jgi:hypothetical protein